MNPVPATITAEVLDHADGRPVAYIDATAIVVFAYQQPDGLYVIDVYTRDDTADGRLRLILDGQPLPIMPGSSSPATAGPAAEPVAAGDGDSRSGSVSHVSCRDTGGGAIQAA